MSAPPPGVPPEWQAGRAYSARRTPAGASCAFLESVQPELDRVDRVVAGPRKRPAEAAPLLVEVIRRGVAVRGFVRLAGHARVNEEQGSFGGPVRVDREPTRR